MDGLDHKWTFIAEEECKFNGTKNSTCFYRLSNPKKRVLIPLEARENS